MGIAATSDAQGYWIAGSDGSVQSGGDAADLGSARSLHRAAPIVGIAATPPRPPCPPDSASNEGYDLVGADGGIFSFGTAEFHGSAADQRLAAPVVGTAVGYQPVATSCPNEPAP
ncbi:MAG: hypothetical protein ACYCTI_06460 [Acidimicrobiales bacterium]